MAVQRFVNNFVTQFAAAVKASPSSGSPSTELDYGILRLPSSAAAYLTALTGGDFYILTAYKTSGSVETAIEILKVTAIDTSVINETRITVTRGYEGTTINAYVSGDYCALRFTAAGAQAMLQASLSSATPLALGTADPGASSAPSRGDHVHPLPSAAAVGAEPAVTAGTTAQYWRGDKSWRDFATDVRAAVLTGLSTATSAVITATDSVLVAAGKLQAQITTLSGQFASYLALAGGTMTGTLLTKAIQHTKVAMAANNIDMATGNAFTKTISGATTLTVSNVPATGTLGLFILDLTNGGSATITWWSGMKWAAGAAPTLTAAGRDTLAFFTHDGGTTWTGLVLGKALA
jgi:hypothetical protein